MTALRVPPWPAGDGDSCSHVFFEQMAAVCKAVNRPDLSSRFLLFAEDCLSPKEREARRLAQRDALIREMAQKHYPVSLGCNGRARLIAGDLAEMWGAIEEDRLVRVRPQNLLLREILELNADVTVGLGFETVKKVLRAAG